MQSGTGSDSAARDRTEVRAFLIADVRGYTRFTREHGDEAGARLAARFAGIARQINDATGGESVEFRGDEALCVFQSPRQALRAAVALQEACAAAVRDEAATPLRVGVGIDVGEAVVVEGGHRGGALNLAARLCSIAKAGEVLVSESVLHLAGQVDGIDYRHRGRASLKGFREPVRYYQASFPLDLPPEPTQTRRTSHNWWTVAAMASLVAVGSLAALLVYQRSGGIDSSLPPNAVANVDTESGRPLSLTQFRGSPTSLAVGLGYTWAADPAGSRIAGIQADGHRQVFVGSGGGGGVTGIAIAAGSLWAVHGDNGTVVKIDPTQLTTVGSPLRVGAGASTIVGSGDQLWVANTDDGTIQRVDATRSRVEAPIPVGSQPSAIAVGLGSVWVLDPANGVLVRIDPTSGEALTTTPVTVGSAAIAAGDGMVWVADPSSDTVIRYDPDAGALRTVAVAGGPATIAVVHGEVWAGTTNGRLVRIEPDSLRVVDSRSIGSPVAALAGSGSSLWVATAPSPAQHRGGTLRVAAEAFDSVDPALAFGVPQATVADLLTNDGLIAFRHVGGAAGSLLVPDLATAIPKPTEDGRTYRFVLRRGLKYSNGTLVRASDVRRGMERALAQTPSEGTLVGNTFLSNLVGADACTPGSCDLSKGVVTDDHTGTVTLRLSQPDSQILYGLTMPAAFPVPAGVPKPGTGPLPATGPYMVKQFIPPKKGHVGNLVMVRNPRFHVWSALARPDGYPDKIVWAVGIAGADQFAPVAAGRYDVAAGPDLQFDARLAREQIAHPSQVHTFAGYGTQSVFLNTTIPPFDDVRARRAVNFGFDRRKLVRTLGGPLTCQFLPPGITGYRPYCPYTVGGGPAYRGPDIARARRLVRASRTAGVRVAVLSTHDPGVPPFFLRYTTQVLRRIGYDATQKFQPNGLSGYFATISNRSANVQVGGYGWRLDFPVPANLLQTVFHCGNHIDPSWFCSRPFDRLVNHAINLEQRDQARAGIAWTNADHLLTNLVPWVPLVNPQGVDFIADRVRNYERNPQVGVLLDQLWVR